MRKILFSITCLLILSAFASDDETMMAELPAFTEFKNKVDTPYSEMLAIHQQLDAIEDDYQAYFSNEQTPEELQQQHTENLRDIRAKAEALQHQVASIKAPEFRTESYKAKLPGLFAFLKELSTHIDAHIALVNAQYDAALKEDGTAFDLIFAESVLHTASLMRLENKMIDGMNETLDREQPQYPLNMAHIAANEATALHFEMSSFFRTEELPNPQIFSDRLKIVQKEHLKWVRRASKLTKGLNKTNRAMKRSNKPLEKQLSQPFALIVKSYSRSLKSEMVLNNAIKLYSNQLRKMDNSSETFTDIWVQFAGAFEGSYKSTSDERTKESTIRMQEGVRFSNIYSQ